MTGDSWWQYCLKQNSDDDKINNRIPHVTKLPDPMFISPSLRNLMCWYIWGLDRKDRREIDWKQKCERDERGEILHLFFLHLWLKLEFLIGLNYFDFPFYFHLFLFIFILFIFILALWLFSSLLFCWESITCQHAPRLLLVLVLTNEDR